MQRKMIISAVGAGPGIINRPEDVKINDPKAKTSYATLEAAWKAWNESQGKVNQGLINRRAAELDIHQQGVYKRW